MSHRSFGQRQARQIVKELPMCTTAGEWRRDVLKIRAREIEIDINQRGRGRELFFRENANSKCCMSSLLILRKLRQTGSRVCAGLREETRSNSHEVDN
jgi:hypothetical protein